MDSHPSIARVRAASRNISLENPPYFVIATLEIGEIFSVIATGQCALANGLIKLGDDLVYRA